MTSATALTRCRLPPPAVLCLALLAAVGVAAGQVTTADYRALAKGVGTIATGDTYSSRLLLHGNALAIAAQGPSAVVAATVHGKGRAVHFAHEGMLSQCCGATGLPRLLTNAAAWAAGAKTSRIRVASGSAFGVDATLVQRLVAANPTKYVNAGTVAPRRLSNAAVDLYIADGYDVALGAAAAHVQRFNAMGGGLINGAHAWYWSYSNPVAQHPSNLLLNPLGIYVSASDVRVAPRLSATTPPVQSAHANVAARCLEDSCTGVTRSACFYKTDDDLTAGMQTIRAFAEFVPATASFWGALDRWSRSARKGINSNVGIARRSKQGLAALARTVRSQVLPPAQLTEASDAAFFPGKPAAGTKPTARPVTRRVTGTTSAQYWQCLGVWAMAGRPVTVTVPAGLASLPGARLRIGGWTDLTYHLTTWHRLPEMSRQYSLTGTRTTIGTATGGLIYLELPSGLRLGPLNVQISGAILAPYYLHGTTSPSTWPSALLHPAPWGEIGSSKLAIATPTSSLRTVADPAAVMNYWDKALDAAAWMAGISTVRPKPERFQHDADISAGYMHAGYPIMTFMDVVNTTLDPANPEKWGHFHELGHNHQDEAWTWECTVEVSVNFFSAYMMSTVQNQTDPRTFYGWNRDGNDVTGRLGARRAYFAGGPSHTKLCSDPGLYLDSFLQLIEDTGLGFGLLKDTIASYNSLPSQLASQLQPDGDDAEIQAWVVQQSRTANRNFAAYYKAWGWPVSAATEAALASLPAYAPPAKG